MVAPIAEESVPSLGVATQFFLGGGNKEKLKKREGVCLVENVFVEEECSVLPQEREPVVQASIQKEACGK